MLPILPFYNYSSNCWLNASIGLFCLILPLFSLLISKSTLQKIQQFSQTDKSVIPKFLVVLQNVLWRNQSTTYGGESFRHLTDVITKRLNKRVNKNKEALEAKHYQKDAHECLCIIIDAICDISTDGSVKNLDYHNYADVMEALEKIPEEVRSCFIILVQSRDGCDPCKHASSTYTIHCSLSLTINQKEMRQREFKYTSKHQESIVEYVTTTELIGLYERMEFLMDKNQWDCEKCGKKVDALTNNAIIVTGQYILLHFQRKQMGGLNRTKIEVQSPLEFFVDDMVEKEKFHLIGCVDYRPSTKDPTLNTGHFYRKIKWEEEWYKVDDYQIMKQGQKCKSPIGTISSKVYLCLYQKEESL